MELWADVLNIPEEIFHHVLSCFLVADRSVSNVDMEEPVFFSKQKTAGNGVGGNFQTVNPEIVQRLADKQHLSLHGESLPEKLVATGTELQILIAHTG
jgi:hypothetical protein